MQVVGKVLLGDYTRIYSDAETPLRNWLTVAEAAAWRNIVEVRGTYPHADYVKPHTVFNIKGNTYRLITIISYHRQLITIERFLTHGSYTRGKWKS